MISHQALAILCATALCAATQAAETWIPADHPATIIHRVDALTHPRDELFIASEFTGRIQTITVDAGDVITGNTDLISVIHIDDTLAVIHENRAQATLAEARAAVAVAEAQQAVRQREADYQQAEYQRIEQLVSAGRLTDREGQAQRFTADSTNLQLAMQQAHVQAAHAAVTSAQQAVAEAGERRARHHLVAPVGWRVSERLREPQAVVAAGEPILVLHDVRQLEVRAHLTEDEIAAIHNQEKIPVQFTDSGQTALAQIDSVDVRANPATRKRMVTLVLDSEDAPSPSGGLSVELAIEVPLGDNSVLVPEALLSRKQQRVFVHTSEGDAIAVVPLRERNGMVVIDGSSLPDQTQLVMPERAQ